VKRINSLVAASLMDARGAGRLVALLRDLDTVLAIIDFDEPRDTHADVHALLQARARARAERNWLLADRIRDELLARGICVQDPKLDS
jgi:cysteinyl-tRNA synthetase